MLHLSAHDSLRAIGQSTRYLRRAEAGLLPADERQHHVSLVFQHRQGLGRILSLGLTRAREQPPLQRSTELFAKAVFAYEP